MKALLTLFIFTVSISMVNAQWWGNGNRVKGNGNVVTENRSVSDYDVVSVSGFFDVDLVAGTEGKLTIKGESNLLEHVITEVDGDKLIIKAEKGYNLKTSNNNKIEIVVPFKDLDMVSLNGSGDVVGKDVIKAKNFKAKLNGSGDIIVQLDAENVRADMNGSGDITLKGETANLEAKVNGSGNIHAFKLIAENAEASVNGSGDADVYCNSTLRARVVGSGDVRYKGNPKKRDNKTIGSGDISKG